MSAAAPPPTADPVAEFFTQMELEEIRKVCILEADDYNRLNESQFTTFIRTCALRKLKPRPFGNHIHPQVRQGKMSIQTGIDGYLLLAERTKKYRGYSEGVFTEDPHNPGWPLCCKVSVHKDGYACPITATAWFAESIQRKKDGTPTPMWARMPRLMLEKVALALALRRAFPEELSGIYTDAEGEPAAEAPPAPLPPPSPTSDTRPAWDGQQPAAAAPPAAHPHERAVAPPAPVAPPPPPPAALAPANAVEALSLVPANEAQAFGVMLGKACDIYKVAWPPMAQLIQGWSSRQGPLFDEKGAFDRLTVGEKQRITSGVKAWEQALRQGTMSAPPPAPLPPAVAERQAADLAAFAQHDAAITAARGAQPAPQPVPPPPSSDAAAEEAARAWSAQQLAQGAPFD